MFSEPGITVPKTPRFLTALVMVGLFAALLWLFTQDNRFSIYYHLDESSKAEQIISGERNFRHPMLQLNAASLLLRASGQPRTFDHAVFCGRWVAAIFAAGAVVGFSVLAIRRTGLWTGFGCGLLVACQPLLIELAHYCKEDPALLLGISLSLLALDSFHARPRAGTAALLGAACAVAASGRYLGVCMAVIAVAFVVRAPRWPALLGAFAAGFLVTLGAVNYQWLAVGNGLVKGLEIEMQLVEGGGMHGLSRKVPHLKYLEPLLANVGWLALVGFAGFGFAVMARRFRKPVDAVLFLFPVLFAVALSFSPKTANRYFLPVTSLLLLAGGLGLVLLAHRLPAARWRRSLALGLLAVALAVQIFLTRSSFMPFKVDSRRDVAAWLHTNLPPGSVVLSELAAALGRDETWRASRRGDLTITEAVFAPDAGTIEELKGKGVQYVVIMRENLRRFSNTDFTAVKDRAAQNARRREAYARLISESDIIYEHKPQGVRIVAPAITVVRLR